MVKAVLDEAHGIDDSDRRSADVANTHQVLFEKNGFKDRKVSFRTVVAVKPAWRIYLVSMDIDTPSISNAGLKVVTDIGQFFHRMKGRAAFEATTRQYDFPSSRRDVKVGRWYATWRRRQMMVACHFQSSLPQGGAGMGRVRTAYGISALAKGFRNTSNPAGLCSQINVGRIFRGKLGAAGKRRGYQSAFWADGFKDAVNHGIGSP